MTATLHVHADVSVAGVDLTGNVLEVSLRVGGRDLQVRRERRDLRELRVCENRKQEESDSDEPRFQAGSPWSFARQFSAVWSFNPSRNGKSSVSLCNDGNLPHQSSFGGES